MRNPFELRAEDLPEQPNYFTCAFRKDKLDKYVFFVNQLNLLTINQMVMVNRDDFFKSAQRSRIVSDSCNTGCLL